MEELEKLEYPKPNREFVYSTFNAFADRHPWVGQENIRPKSIAREMFENFRSFCGLHARLRTAARRGLLLRHLNSVYKVLAQTVPDTAKNDQVREMELYLGTMLRQVDSSLLDEWEKMRDPNYRVAAEAKEVRPPGAEEADQDITRDMKAFTAAIRNRILHFPARPGDWRLRTSPGQSQRHPNDPMASRGPRDVCSKSWMPIYADHQRILPRSQRAQSSATPTSLPPKTNEPGVCNKCWSIRKSTTTGSQNSKSISANLEPPVPQLSDCNGSERSPRRMVKQAHAEQLKAPVTPGQPGLTRLGSRSTDGAAIGGTHRAGANVKQT